jgi:hypothetical protein
MCVLINQKSHLPDASKDVTYEPRVEEIVRARQYSKNCFDFNASRSEMNHESLTSSLFFNLILYIFIILLFMSSPITVI